MHPRRLRCSSLKYSRYCTPPCTTRTVGAPPVGRRAVRYRGPQRGSRAGVVVGAPRPSRCDARLSPRAVNRATSAVTAVAQPPSPGFGEPCRSSPAQTASAGGTLMADLVAMATPHSSDAGPVSSRHLTPERRTALYLNVSQLLYLAP